MEVKQAVSIGKVGVKQKLVKLEQTTLEGEGLTYLRDPHHHRRIKASEC